MTVDRGRLTRTVLESNRQARDAWERWAPHRARTTAILSALGAPGASLCILGPGNLNDVDVEELAASFAEIALVDLDAGAVHAAVANRRRVAGLRVHARTDLTGVLDRLEAFESHDGARRVIGSLERHRCAVAGRPFDVTASTGLLTQMLQSVVDAGLAGDDVARVALALRDKHLQDLVALTSPSGAFALISDVVASTTAPRLLGASDDELEPLMAELVAAGNFFTATNPYRIVALLEEDERFRHAVREARLLDPWRWAVTPDRLHLTYAIVAHRR